MVLRVVGLGPFLALFFLLLMATASAAFEVTSATSAVACESFALSWPGAQLPVYYTLYYGPPGGPFSPLGASNPSLNSGYSPVIRVADGYQIYYEVVDNAGQSANTSTFTFQPPVNPCEFVGDPFPSASLQPTNPPPPPTGSPPPGSRLSAPPSSAAPDTNSPAITGISNTNKASHGWPATDAGSSTASGSAQSGASAAGVAAAPTASNTDALAAGSEKSKSSNVGAIAGGVVGGIVGLILLILLALLCLRRRRRQDATRNRNSSSPESNWAAGGLKSSSSSTRRGNSYGYDKSGSDNSEAEQWPHPDAGKGPLASPGLAPSHATSSSRTLATSAFGKGLSTPKRNTMISTASSMPSTPEVPHRESVPPGSTLFAHGFPAPPPRSSVQSSPSPARMSVQTLPNAPPVPGSEGHGGPWGSQGDRDLSDDEPTSPRLPSGPVPPPRRKQKQLSIGGLSSTE